jgi:phenylpropionate dioxygenase-like ring-hydroxylating dioxygenase large terminal subunit
VFTSFANVWTPVAAASALKRKPLAVKLAGEPVVLFRNKTGRASALIDRCPHRGVALSLGIVNGDGCLECPFHGWSFRGDGACDHIPLSNLSKQKLQHYAATALETREIGGLLWVFSGQDPAGTEPELPPTLLDRKWHSWVYEETWNTHWTRAMENMLDNAHVPFVHRRSFGGQMRSKMRKDSLLTMEIDPRPWGASFSHDFDGEIRRDFLSWRRPNGMELHLPFPFGEVRLHVYCVPMGGNQTRMILVNARNYLRGKTISRLLDRGNGKILSEDRSVVESAQPPEVPPPGEELSVASDGPTLHFRRYYYRELRGGTAALVPSARLTARASAPAEPSPAPAPSIIGPPALLTPAETA